MVSFKACQRCQVGDVVRENDLHGWYEMCLQCGYVRDLKGPDDVVVELADRSTDREPEPVSA